MSSVQPHHDVIKSSSHHRQISPDSHRIIIIKSSFHSHQNLMSSLNPLHIRTLLHLHLILIKSPQTTTKEFDPWIPSQKIDSHYKKKRRKNKKENNKHHKYAEHSTSMNVIMNSLYLKGTSVKDTFIICPNKHVCDRLIFISLYIYVCFSLRCFSVVLKYCSRKCTFIQNCRCTVSSLCSMYCQN